MKRQADDFIVTEIDKVSPSGTGEHIWLKIQKMDANTDWVAAQLARIAGVKKRDVGFAGLKDRKAITTQWFSIYLPKGDVPTSTWLAELPQGVKLLKETRHDRKLRRGTLKGNHFSIIIRNCVFDGAELALLVEQVRTQGMPNYFGKQRFGHDYRNIVMVKQWFQGDARVKARNKRSIYLSAARSWIFNHILATRIEQGTWNKAIVGDVFMLQGSHSCFVDDGDELIQQRIDTGNIHPTAALWGSGALNSHADMLKIEQSISSMEPILCKGLEEHGLKQERRAMRVAIADLAFDVLDEHTLRFEFSLPPGSYATVLLEQLGVLEINKASSACENTLEAVTCVR
jgi:tRNA pseudouridine13 synthase